jgi:choline transport protein
VAQPVLVYHWASVTAGPEYGRVCSWLAGWYVLITRMLSLESDFHRSRWNCFAWTFGTASVSLFGANAILAIYSLYHLDYSPQRWQIFIAYLGVTWTVCAVVLFGQRILPRIANTCAFLCLTIWFVTVMVCAIMPSQTGKGYASNAFVWQNWDNQTGYSSNGFVFCAGMLNGAFAIGTPDGATHRKFKRYPNT